MLLFRKYSSLPSSKVPEFRSFWLIFGTVLLLAKFQSSRIPKFQGTFEKQFLLQISSLPKSKSSVVPEFQSSRLLLKSNLSYLPSCKVLEFQSSRIPKIECIIQKILHLPKFHKFQGFGGVPRFSAFIIFFYTFSTLALFSSLLCSSCIVATVRKQL